MYREGRKEMEGGRQEGDRKRDGRRKTDRGEGKGHSHRMLIMVGLNINFRTLVLEM